MPKLSLSWDDVQNGITIVTININGSGVILPEPFFEVRFVKI